MKKKKKEKIIYVDDGRTIADMSNVSSRPHLGSKSSYRPSPRFKDVWKTYWGAVKMMFGPMLVVIVALGIIYMVLYALFLFIP